MLSLLLRHNHSQSPLSAFLKILVTTSCITMAPIQGWFKSRKSLRVSRKSYYEDIFGEKNPEEELEGVHILGSDSDSDPGVFSRRSRCQGHKKPRIALRQSNKDRSDRGNKMDTADGNELATPRIDRSTGTRTTEPKPDHGMLANRNLVVTIDDDDSDVGEQFVTDLQKHGLTAALRDYLDITEIVQPKVPTIRTTKTISKVQKATRMR